MMISVWEMVQRIQNSDVDLEVDLELVQMLVDGAVAFVESQTRRSFRPEHTFEEVIKGLGSPRLWLSEPPITGLSYEGLTVLETAFPGADPVEIEEGAPDGFHVRLLGNEREREGVLVRLGRLVWRKGFEYTVRYTRGYAEGEFPADIVDVVAGLVSLRLSLAGMEAVRSESIGGYSYTRFGEGDLDAIPGARDTIEAWKRHVLA